MKKIILFFTIIFFSINAAANTPIHHKISTSIDPDASTIDVEDEMTFHVSKSTKTLQFKISINYSGKIESLVKQSAENYARGFSDFAYSGIGVKFAGIADDSSAAKAGLKTGNIIIDFNSNPINNIKDYSNQLKALQPGDTVEVPVKRDKKEQTVKLTLGAR